MRQWGLGGILLIHNTHTMAYMGVATVKNGTTFISSLAPVREDMSERLVGWHSTRKLPLPCDLTLDHHMLFQGPLDELSICHQAKLHLARIVSFLHPIIHSTSLHRSIFSALSSSLKGAYVRS